MSSLNFYEVSFSSLSLSFFFYMKKKIRFLSVKLITEDDDYYKKLNIDILYGEKKP